MLTIGIDHDTVCAGVVGTAIRNSTSCAGRRAAAPAGTTSAVPDCSTNHDSADRISGQFLFYHDHNFTKSNGNLRFQRLVPLFVPIGICVTTHDDGTASDVTIDPSHKSHNASHKYPIMHHLVTEMCTHVHISVTKCCIVGYGTDAFWDLWNGSIGMWRHNQQAMNHERNGKPWFSFPK